MPTAPGAHLQPPHGQAQLHRRVALALDAQQLGGGDAAILEHELVGALAAEHRDFALDDEAFGAALDDEGGDALGALALAGARHDDDEVGLRHPANPDLAAVDDPVAAVLHRARGHAGRDRRPRRARRWRSPSAPRRGRKARGISRFCSSLATAISMCRLGLSGGKVNGRAGAALFLIDADQRGVGQVGAAVFLRHVEAPEAEFLAGGEDLFFLLLRQAGGLAGHFPGEGGLFQRDQVAVDEFRHQLLEHAVFFGQFEHAAILHPVR